jgi:hypothetical protein
MERGLASQPTGPGALARVGERIAAANQLIQASRKAVAQATVQIQQSHDRLGRPDQRGHDSAGRARAAHRSAAAAGQRFLRAKQRELAAHDRAILRHKQAAELQERLGHPDRAANARTHAQHARELRQQALQELRDWQARTPASSDAHQLPHRRDRFTLGGMRTATQAYSTATQRADGNAACRRGCGLPPGIR